MALRLIDHGHQQQLLAANPEVTTLAKAIVRLVNTIPTSPSTDTICWLLGEHDDGEQALLVAALTEHLPQWHHQPCHYLPFGAAAVAALLARPPHGDRWLLLAVDLVAADAGQLQLQLGWQLWQRSDHGLQLQALVVGIAGQRLELAIADLLGQLAKQLAGTLQAAILPAHASELWAGAFVALDGCVDGTTDYRFPSLPHRSATASAGLDGLLLLYQQFSRGWWFGQALMLTLAERRHAGAIIARWGSV
ncbi:MAG: hypothetical protein II007_03890 [Gammaproteobacteria bacterium]|nr:hypothetical protein [Gammaproteobacteria bacterium]